MDLLREYINQNAWRDWQRYLEKLPLNENQTVYDLGCSIGAVSKLFSEKTKSVTGFDNNGFLLSEAGKDAGDNCSFVSADIFTLEPEKLEKCDGIWSSFTLAYMEDPQLFISKWMKCLNNNGWFAITDIDGLFSNHLSKDNKYLMRIQEFENESAEKGIYDFKIGGKIKNLMENCGLEVIVSEEDWYDAELNFKGKADGDIAENWRARLARMVKLKEYLDDDYEDFCDSFLNEITHEGHDSHGCVKFYAGIKKY